MVPGEVNARVGDDRQIVEGVPDRNSNGDNFIEMCTERNVVIG